jgi:hypothetical protein
MLLSKINFSKIVDISSPDRWGKDDPTLDRKVYHDPEKDLYIKVWAPPYQDFRRACYQREMVLIPSANIFGIDVGFFNRTTAPAFVELIVDDKGECRGYVTRAGTRLITSSDPVLFAPFIEAVKEATRLTQFAHTDMCYNNLVLIDGRLSFIDYDTVLTSTLLMEKEYETQYGCLREHVYDWYRDFLMSEYRTDKRGTAV